MAVYAAVVFSAWTIWVVGGSDLAAFVAIAISLPIGICLELPLLLAFVTVGLDPTTSAPHWQNVLAGCVVVTVMTLASVGQAALARQVVRTVRARHATTT
jgi:hypothetical protein